MIQYEKEIKGGKQPRLRDGRSDRGWGIPSTGWWGRGRLGEWGEGGRKCIKEVRRIQLRRREEGGDSEDTQAQSRMGWGEKREEAGKKIKEGCIKKLLSTSDRDWSTFFTCPESYFLFSAESLPVVWLPSICLYPYSSRIRKENYFHISNSLNASMFVAQSLLDLNALFLHIWMPTWRHCQPGHLGWEAFCHAYG